MTESWIDSPEIVVRNDLVRRIGGFRAELPHAGDFELWMRLALHADVAYVRGPDQAYYRNHAAGMHHRQFGAVSADLLQIKAAFEILFREYGRMLANREPLEMIVTRMLARRALRAACRIYDRGERDLAEVARLEELAVTTYRDACALGEWRALQRRKPLGPRLCWVLQPFLPMTAQGVYRVLRRRGLQRKGMCLQRAGGWG